MSVDIDADIAEATADVVAEKKRMESYEADRAGITESDEQFMRERNDMCVCAHKRILHSYIIKLCLMGSTLNDGSKRGGAAAELCPCTGFKKVETLEATA